MPWGTIFASEIAPGDRIMLRAACTPAAFFLLLLASLTPGCSRDTLVGPDANATHDLRAGRDAAVVRNDLLPGGGWYPMAAGNQWRYRGRSFTEVVSPLGARDTVTNAEFELLIEQLGGQADPSEIQEKWTETFTNGGSASAIRPVRQTRDGLWRILASDPLVETQLLAYPPHPGQTWMSGGFGLQSRMTVEAHETLRTPAGNLPAWRVRMDDPLRGPDDYRYVWYGRAGYLQMVSHAESLLPDGSIVRSDHTHHLESIHLAGSGRFATAKDRAATPLGLISNR